jgi:class 3 adenylate cyclase
VQLVEGASGSGILISVDASDVGSGVGEIVAVRYRDGVVSSVSVVNPDPLPTDGTFVVDFADFQPDDEFVVHVIDGSGNVATDSAKGNLIQFIEVDAGPDQFVAAEQPVTFTGTVFEFADTADLDGLTPPVRFQWSFGDGETLEGELSSANPDIGSFDVDAAGTATFSVTHEYDADHGGSLQAPLFVIDGTGSTGLDSTTVFVCGDPRDVVLGPSANIDAAQADLIGCGVQVAGDEMTITLVTDGDLEVGGVPTTGDISYRLRVGLTTGTASKLLKYKDGDVTGMRSLEVTIVGNTINFTFSLKELGKKGQNASADVTFSAETRAGVPSTGAAGLVDELPDSGTIVFPPAG